LLTFAITTLPPLNYRPFHRIAGTGRTTAGITQHVYHYHNVHSHRTGTRRIMYNNAHTSMVYIVQRWDTNHRTRIDMEKLGDKNTLNILDECTVSCIIIMYITWYGMAAVPSGYNIIRRHNDCFFKFFFPSRITQYANALRRNIHA